MPIDALVVDDEPLARDNLRHALGSFAGWRVVGECDGAAAARRLLAEQPVDVLFLDIQMGRESGLGLARSLADREAPPVIVFVTAFEQFAIDAFDVHALDYLLKPFDDARLAQTIERVEQLLQLKRAAYGTSLRDGLEDIGAGGSAVGTHLRRLTLRSVGHIECVEIDLVNWLSAAGNYVELHLAGRTLMHRATFGTLSARLDPAVLIRTHRSVVVRRDQCVALSVAGDGVYALRLRCGDVVPVSERYVQGVREVLSG